MDSSERTYALVTPVHNEEKLIGQVIESILAQTMRPKKWVIVNDRSTDRSQLIIDGYRKDFDFIRCINIKDEELTSYYARRTEVFLYGYKSIADEEYDYIGCLDADITMPPDYYANILAEFSINSRLGVASGVYLDLVEGVPREVRRASISTPGAIQLFRQACYRQIAGYIPLKYGGDDAVADIMARMAGWETRSFPAYKVVHHRPSGTGTGQSIYKARYYQGKTDYGIGTHPVFMLAKTLSRGVRERPRIVGSLTRLLGYMAAALAREPCQVPREVTKYLRQEQLGRMLAGAARILGVHRSTT